MAKADFSKAEESFQKDLEQFKIDKLIEGTENEETSNAIQQFRMINRLLTLIQYEIKGLKRKGVNCYEVLKIDKNILKSFIKDPNTVSIDDWKILREWKEQIDVLKKAEEAKELVTTDEDIVDKERKVHINKRFNVSDKWLPLK